MLRNCDSQDSMSLRRSPEFCTFSNLPLSGNYSTVVTFLFQGKPRGNLRYWKPDTGNAGDTEVKNFGSISPLLEIFCCFFYWHKPTWIPKFPVFGTKRVNPKYYNQTANTWDLKAMWVETLTMLCVLLPLNSYFICVVC